MCAVCDAYDEVMDVVQQYDLTNDEGIQLLANLVLTFNGKDPVRTILMLGLLNGRVLEILSPEEATKH